MSEQGRSPKQARQWRLALAWADEDPSFATIVRLVCRDILEGWSPGSSETGADDGNA